MKNAIVMSVLSMIFATASAQADGFRCVGQNTGLTFAIYNHTDAGTGTRSPAIFVISDPTLARSDRTIASFSGDESGHGRSTIPASLAYFGYGSYVAKVSPYLNETIDAGRFIAGTKLESLDSINLAISFSYASGNSRLARVTESIPGKLYYHKRTGEVLEEVAACVRYLKNP